MALKNIFRRLIGHKTEDEKAAESKRATKEVHGLKDATAKIQGATGRITRGPVQGVAAS